MVKKAMGQKGMEKLARGIGQSRKFGGKTYYLQTMAKTKREANEVVRRVKKQGYLARTTAFKTVSGKTHYAVWSRSER